MPDRLHEPWLVAAWPGMGGIGQIGVNYLAQALGARPVAEIPVRDWLDLRSIRVRAGKVQESTAGAAPLLGWKHDDGGRNLLLFAGEEQPDSGRYRFCQALLDRAQEHGVTRVVTFAAMATALRPDGDPRVFAAATSDALLEELRPHGVELLADGEISGMNGVLLAAAAERGLDAVCLLGEFPYFAASFPNPKSSAALLRTFAALAGIRIDLAPIDARAAQLQKQMMQILEQLEAAAARASEERREQGDEDFESGEEGGLDPQARARIEALFREAAQDRTKAMELKAELDRHGAFGEYEDRFLDLFKQGE